MGETSCFDCIHHNMCRLHYHATMQGQMQSTDVATFCRFYADVYMATQWANEALESQRSKREEEDPRKELETGYE